MARRGRVIGVALGLIALFLFITSRNSGSHPRDLKSTKENQEPLRPIIKEPPGTWDPVKDGFRDQQSGNPGSGSGRSGQEKPEAVMKQDTPAEDVSRKTPKKADPAKAADIAKGQPEPKKEVKKPGQGSGAVVPGTEEKEDQIVIDEYDPAEDLRVILTQAPMIIFSKTHCPHSKDAKRILLEQHTISPAPYVVELDKHPNGQALQNHLGVVTGRRTVPNVIVNGVSIGGGDDMRALEAAGTVAETLLSKLAGKITVDGLSSM